MENKTDNKAEQNKKARNTVGLFLTIIMMGLTVYVLYVQSENYKVLEATTDLSLNANNQQSGNYRHYVKQYVDTRAQLMDTQSRLGKMTMELELVSKELESTKSVLSETQILLAQYQQGNNPSKDDQAMAQNAKEGQKNLGNMKKQNENYSGELAKLKSELDSYQVDVGDLKEGSSLISDLRNKIRMVREKMSALKKEAHDAKVAAQNERNRQLMLLGNNGYATKDGELTLVSKRQKTVNIDVKFVP